MKRNRMTWMAAVLGMAAFTSLVGCGKGMKAGDKGAATLNVHSFLQVTDAKSAKVVVQGAAESVNLTIPLVANATSTQWSAVVSDLPIGSDYVFTATAYAADGTTVLYTGAVSGQSIAKNQTASIVIDMNQVAPTVSLYDEAPVIVGLTETASCVSKNDTVTIKATAYDPDAGDTAGMAWSWSVDATCGTLSAPVNVAGTDMAHPGTSTVTFTATASSANCQVNLTIADAQQPAVLMTTGSVTISSGDACALGNAKITAIPNTCPVMSNVGAVVGPVPGDGTPSYVPMVVGQSTFVTVSATDADNDTLLYSWSSPDCAGGTPATTFGNWNDSTAKAGTWFLLTSAPPSGTCTFLVHVSDGTFADGKAKCDIVNHLSLPVKGANDVVKANPVFGFDYMSTDKVNDGTSVKLEIVAPTTGCPSPYTLTWNPAGTALTTLDPPFTTGITFTAPAGAGANGATVTVTATCPDSGLSTVHSFILIGETAVCNGAADGTDCTSTAQLTDKCVTLAKCSANSCVVQTSVTCPASTVACQDNVCGHLTDGLCHLQDSSDGTGCNDNHACTTADKCAAGVCGGTAVTCTASSNLCQVNACVEPSGACVLSNAPAGTACTDGNGCTGNVGPTGDSCSASGVCVGGAPVDCGSGNVCVSNADGSNHTCSVYVCLAPSYAVAEVPPMAGLATDPTDGSPWITGSLYTPNDFGTGTISSTGSADMYVAKLNPATGLATGVFMFTDTSSKDQVATGIAVTANGSVAVTGTTNGEVDFPPDGTINLIATVSTPFYGVLDNAGNGVIAHLVDVGTGSIMSIGSNPGRDEFAICGKTSKIMAASTNSKGLLKGTTGGNTAFNNGDAAGGNFDLFVAKISLTSGTWGVTWGAQFGGKGDQVCESVAIDSAGNVLIAGNYSGDLFGLPTVADISGTSANLFMAKLNASSGTLASAKSWGGSGRSDAFALTVDKDGNVIMGGAIGSAITFDSHTVAYAGLTDAFVAKFDSTLTNTWAISDGDAGYDQAVKAVATDSNGNVFISGAFKGNLPYLGLGDSTHNGALDGFVATILPDGSKKDCAHAYGDANGAQSVSMLSVPRTATTNKDAIFEAGAFTSTITFGSTTLTQSGTATNSFVVRASK